MFVLAAFAHAGEWRQVIGWEEGIYRRTPVVGAIPVQVAVTQQNTTLTVTVR